MYATDPEIIRGGGSYRACDCGSGELEYRCVPPVHVAVKFRNGDRLSHDIYGPGYMAYEQNGGSVAGENDVLIAVFDDGGKRPVYASDCEPDS